MTTHYDTLGVATDATQSTIGAQYRSLKALYSGDVGTYGLLTEESQQASLSEIERAYFVLCDVSRRRVYDRKLADCGHVGPWHQVESSQHPLVSPSPSADTVELDQVGEDTLLDVQGESDHIAGADATASEVPKEQALLQLDPPGDKMDGAYLRSVRELRGINLDDIATAIKISATQLEYIEDHRFDKLPAPVYLRGFLRSYAMFVGVESDQLIQDFLRLRDEWESAQP